MVLDDPLPAGLEPVDLSLRTRRSLPAGGRCHRRRAADDAIVAPRWYFGSLGLGLVEPVRPQELRDDRVVYSATVLWPGTYTATYLARATTPGTFRHPQTHAEEMYNPA